MDTCANDLLVKARAKIVAQSAKAATATGEARTVEETLLSAMRVNLVQLEIQALISSDDAFSSLSNRLAGVQSAS